MNFFCTVCDKSFIKKHNYERHLKTKKHINLSNTQHLKSPESTLKSPENYLNIQNNLYTCEYCSSVYKSQRSKTKHTNICLKKKLIELKKENESLKVENKELKEENESLKENSIDITKLALKTQKGNTNINNSSYNIIINQYKDAPNLILPKDLEINESLDKYIESGNPDGIVSFLDKYYGSKVPPESRSIWCIDATRSKFVLKYNNEWLIDLDANKFRELTFYPLQDMFYAKQKEIMNSDEITNYTNMENSKLLSSVKFLGGFVDKKEQMKIIRDLSKKIHFKKDNENTIEEIKEIEI